MADCIYRGVHWATGFALHTHRTVLCVFSARFFCLKYRTHGPARVEKYKSGAGPGAASAGRRSRWKQLALLSPFNV